MTGCASRRASKAPFTFIMQIMFGNPSLSLTFSWAAPDYFMPLTHELTAHDLSHRSGSGVSVGGMPLSTPSGSLGEERDLLDKPFQLTLARSALALINLLPVVLHLDHMSAGLTAQLTHILWL